MINICYKTPPLCIFPFKLDLLPAVMKTLLTLKQFRVVDLKVGVRCIAWFSAGMEEEFDIWGGYFAFILQSCLPESHNLFSQ